MKIGAIEAGGTKFVCAIANAHNEILEQTSFPTTTPEETLAQVFNFFDQHTLDAIGIGSFGPIEIDPNSPQYGSILSTPKLAWKDFDFLGAIKSHTINTNNATKTNYATIPTAWTTDVNCSVIGESTIGAAKSLQDALYITIGTGIGAGAILNGKLLAGIGHPEMGHLLVKPHAKDTYEGSCPYHKTCLEGMAAGPSINGRLGISGAQVSPDHEVWDFIAYYLAQALVDFTVILRPERIILGGGTMKVPGLLAKIKTQFKDLLADYVPVPNLDDYIVLPGLGDNAGILGAVILANQTLNV